MKHERGGPIDRPALVRRSLLAAAGATEPEVSRLVAAVPGLIAEARRRTAEPGSSSTLGAYAWRLVPTLTLATAVAVALAFVALLARQGTTAARPETVETLILEESSHTDALLDAVLAAEGNDG
jgi:hypothetical protein